jgi:hypothetical protein
VKANATGIGRVNAGDAFLKVTFSKETPEVCRAVLEDIAREQLAVDAIFLNAFHRENKDVSWAT